MFSHRHINAKQAHKLVSESEIDLVGSCLCRRLQRGFKPPQTWLIIRAAAIIANISLHNKCSPKKSSSLLWEWYKHTRILTFYFVVLTQLMHTCQFPAGSYFTSHITRSSAAEQPTSTSEMFVSFHYTADDLKSFRKAKTAGTSRRHLIWRHEVTRKMRKWLVFRTVVVVPGFVVLQRRKTVMKRLTGAVPSLWHLCIH